MNDEQIIVVSIFWKYENPTDSNNFHYLFEFHDGAVIFISNMEATLISYV